MLNTTLFDQPACTGRSASLNTYLTDYNDPVSWEENLTNYGIDAENTVFRSVILEPESQLTLIDEDGESYNLVNFDYFPSCEELPAEAAKFITYVYTNHISYD